MRKGSTLQTTERNNIQFMQIDRVQDQYEKNLEAGRLLVGAAWFEVDAYGAATAGIIGAIDLGFRSGSLGVGAEEDILIAVIKLLMKMDKNIAAGFGAAVTERLSRN